MAADPEGLMSIVTHPAATGVGAGGAVAVLLRWLASKETQEVSTRLALIDERLMNIGKKLDKYEDLAERVGNLKSAVKALHERVDRIEKDNERRENG